jgi:DNA-binding IclR family transcriptional regulator
MTGELQSAMAAGLNLGNWQRKLGASLPECIMKEPDEDRQFVTALARGLAVLRCFTPKTPELGTTEIARLTGLPQPTVWRLCHTLIQSGYLVSVPHRQTLRPGIPVLTLGHAVLASQPVAEIALAEMQAIAMRYEGAVSLGARDALSMIYLQRCQGSAIVFSDLHVGSRVPLATSGTGWAYLAGLPARERGKLLSELKADMGSAWSDVERPLHDALANFVKTGHVINKGILHKRINSVAVPLTSSDGSTRFALSAGGIVDVFTPDKLSQVGEDLKSLALKLEPVISSNTRTAI